MRSRPPPRAPRRERGHRPHDLSAPPRPRPPAERGRACRTASGKSALRRRVRGRRRALRRGGPEQCRCVGESMRRRTRAVDDRASRYCPASPGCTGRSNRRAPEYESLCDDRRRAAGADRGRQPRDLHDIRAADRPAGFRAQLHLEHPRTRRTVHHCGCPIARLAAPRGVETAIVGRGIEGRSASGDLPLPPCRLERPRVRIDKQGDHVGTSAGNPSPEAAGDLSLVGHRRWPGHFRASISAGASAGRTQELWGSWSRRSSLRRCT